MLSIGLLIMFAIAILIGGFFFGMTGFFALLGVTYYSYRSLIFFVILCLLVGIPVELLSKAIIITVTNAIHTKWRRLVFSAIVDICSTWVIIHSVDAFMKSIDIPALTEWLAAILLFCIEAAFGGRSKKK